MDGIYGACVCRIQGVGQAVVAELVDKLDERSTVVGVEVFKEAHCRCEGDANNCGEETKRKIVSDETLFHG
jgi:hypothetical protein